MDISNISHFGKNKYRIGDIVEDGARDVINHVFSDEKYNNSFIKNFYLKSSLPKFQ